jgi:Tfp pilus assembly protein PilF
MRDEAGGPPEVTSRLAAIALCLLLGACAHRPLEGRDALFADHLFGAPAERMSSREVFALSEPMRRYIETEMAGPLARRGLHKGLIDELYRANGLRLDYDAAVTRNAAEAFEARSGNCLSLVIMTAAFAKALGLTVRYQVAFIEPAWSRVGGMHFLSGHINLVLAGKSTAWRTVYDAGEHLMVDFLPGEELRGLRTWPIAEETVVAMFRNNRAAESLGRGQVDDAYWWARAAIGEDPSFLSAYNTLAVVYLRRGEALWAERVLRAVLEREPGNPAALSNLLLALERQGRLAESEVLQRKLARIEPYPAFHFLDRGLSAMRLGDFKTARELFAREVERDPYYHESHFWLAIANANLGNLEAARKHLDLALVYSSTRGERELYAAKLERIRADR